MKINKTKTIHLICGARPNFVKIAPLHKELSKYKGLDVKIIHTGQHYIKSLSDSFFQDLEIPEPDFFLNIGSGTHAAQTAACMIAYEKLCLKNLPFVCVVVGDVNSTLACCLVAKKLNIPVAHVESGLRSFDKSMPEEINRTIVDRISDLHFTPSEDANVNLRHEGISESSIHFVGNVMIDSLTRSLAKVNSSSVLSELNLSKKKYVVITLHRPSNVDKTKMLFDIFLALSRASDVEFVFPVHPRTMKKINEIERKYIGGNLKFIEPLSYINFLKLVKEAKFVITDSGGIQEETSYLGIPCLTLRKNTERPITITHGTNTLVSIGDITKTLKKKEFMQKKAKKIPFWDGQTAARISNILAQFVEEM